MVINNKLVNIEDDILDSFKNKYCNNMIGKQKLFLFLACRGKKSDALVMLRPTGSRSDVTYSSSEMVTEQLNDSFVASSTTTERSPFITVTCQVLIKEADTMVFQDMFTKIRMKRESEGIHTDENMRGVNRLILF